VLLNLQKAEQIMVTLEEITTMVPEKELPEDQEDHQDQEADAKS
jgi:hypothetical protein